MSALLPLALAAGLALAGTALGSRAVQEGLDPDALSVEALKGHLRGLHLPVGGTRAKLAERLRVALEVRARYAGRDRVAIEASALREELAADCRRLGYRVSGTKRELALRLARFAALPLAPRAPAAAASYDLVWTNPISGQQEVYRERVSLAEAERARARARVQWDGVLLAARHHVAGLSDPDFTIRSAGVVPAASRTPEMDQALELLGRSAREERGAMGPALSGDVAELRRVRQRIEAAQAQLQTLRAR